MDYEEDASVRMSDEDELIEHEKKAQWRESLEFEYIHDERRDK
ncbi:MAG: hypothetical protein ACYCS1_05300 [Gammaproteobacteria bacterium]